MKESSKAKDTFWRVSTLHKRKMQIWKKKFIMMLPNIDFEAQIDECLPPTKESPAPLLSTMASLAIAITGYSFTWPSEENKQ